MTASAALRFERIAWADVDWNASARYADFGLFQTRAWIEFLAEVQHAEPVAALLTDGTNEYGRFSGLLVRRWGLRFLGSPLPGWTTPFMGFNVHPDVPRQIAATALADFAFRDLRAIHLELRDRRLTDADVEHLGFSRRRDVGYDDRTFELDLTQTEDVLFGNMESACRRCIRQAEKRGLTIEEASSDGFAEEFFNQLTEVFLRQGLIPTYNVARVEALIRHLEPTGQLLLLRARNSDGLSIATGIYPAAGDTALFWGGASLRAHQNSRPNESLHWHAMRYWKERGIARYDLGGFMDYKRKYGGEEVSIPGFRRSRSPLISALRSAAPQAMRSKQRLVGRLRRGEIAALDQPQLTPVQSH